MNKLLVFIFLLPFFVRAQSSCDSAQFVKDSLFVQTKTDSVLWLKFKAKGKKLNLKVLNVKTGLPMDYTLYNHSLCEKIKDESILPLRKISKGLSYVTEEKWQILLEKGYCACDQCFAKIEVDEKINLNLVQEQFYLLKIESENQSIKLQMQFSAIALTDKKFDLKSSKDQLEVGMVYQIKDVHFKESSMEYSVPNPPELNELLVFMNAFPTLKIEIQGHVNGPFNSDPELFRVKSNERALKIKSYLTKNGISSDRIVTIGLGNTQMRYPMPKSEWEAEQNRRIEIVIKSI